MRRLAIYFLLSLVIPGGVAFGQSSLQVVDRSTGKPVPYAHVLVEGIDCRFRDQKVTDASGVVACALPCRSSVKVSFVGYKALADTVSPGAPVVLELEPDIVSVEGVVVTAQYTPQPADRSIYKVDVINHLQLREKGAVNLEDALRSEVNIRTSRDAVLGSSLSLQGLGGEHVKFLVDGVPVIGRMNGNIDLGQLNMNNVDHIEILEGPMSVIYGSNALAGAINIITKEPDQSSITGQANFHTETKGTTNGDVQASFSGRHNSVSLSGGRYFLEGYRGDSTLRSYLWKPKRQWFGDIAYSHRFDKANLTLRYDHFDELLLDKGNLLAPYYEKAFDKYYHTVRDNLKLLYRRNLRSGSYVDLIASASGYDRVKTTYLKDLTTLDEFLTANENDHDTTIFTNYLLRTTFSNQVHENPFKYQLGIDLNREIGRGKRMADGEQVMADYGIFFSFIQDLGERWQLQPGIRLAYNNTYKAKPVYSLNVKYNPSGQSLLRFSYARGFRAPSLKELYLYFVDVNHDIQGNPDLGAEDSHNLNASADWRKQFGNSSLRIEGSAFYNVVNNIITLAEIQDLEYTYVNLDEFRSAGLKGEMTLRVHPGFSLKAGLARTGRLSVTDASMAGSAKFAYGTDVNANLSWSSVPHAVVFSVYYKYNGKLPTYRLDAEGELVEGFVGSYHMLDMSVSKKLWRDRIMLTAGINNLLDNVSVESSVLGGGTHGGGGAGHLVGIGRTGFVKVSYSFSKYFNNRD